MSPGRLVALRKWADR